MTETLGLMVPSMAPLKAPLKVPYWCLNAALMVPQ